MGRGETLGAFALVVTAVTVAVVWLAGGSEPPGEAAVHVADQAHAAPPAEPEPLVVDVGSDDIEVHLTPKKGD